MICQYENRIVGSTLAVNIWISTYMVSGQFPDLLQRRVGPIITAVEEKSQRALVQKDATGEKKDSRDQLDDLRDPPFAATFQSIVLLIP